MSSRHFNYSHSKKNHKSNNGERYGINIVNKLIESNYMQEIEAKFDLVQKMPSDYGHFDLVFPYVGSINQYTNGDFDSIPFNLKCIKQNTNKHRCSEFIV